MIKYLIQILPLLLFTSCSNSSNFISRVLNFPSLNFDIDNVQYINQQARVEFRLYNSTGKELCYRKYGKDSGPYSPLVVFDSEFSERAQGSGIYPDVPYTIEKVLVGETEKLVATGRFSGSQRLLEEKGRFLIIFLAVNCEGGNTVTQFRSEIFAIPTAE